MKNPTGKTILILGAGPAGTSSALFLAKKGIPSILIDKATFPRDKICGDALSGKVVEVFKKLDPTLIDRIAGDETTLGSWGVTFVAPNTKALRVPFKMDMDKSQNAPGFIAKRLDFDNFLMEECRRQPLIAIREGVTAWQFEKLPDGWRVLDKSGNLIAEADLVIVADGAHSRFARQISKIAVEPKHYCAGLRAYYKGVKGLDEDNFIELHFLKDFLPGYFWIFPLPNGMANVGVGMRSDVVSKKKVNLKKQMTEIIEKYPELKDRFAGAEMVGDIHGFGLPLGSKKRAISGPNYLLTGDAASLIDPFTGEGIGNAVYCGYFVAEQVARSIEKEGFGREALAQYDNEVYGRLWEELKLGRRMQQLVKFPWLFNLVVNKAQKNKVLRDTISCMFEDLDLREQLKSPAFYFRLLFNIEKGEKAIPPGQKQ